MEILRHPLDHLDHSSHLLEDTPPNACAGPWYTPIGVDLGLIRGRVKYESKSTNQRSLVPIKKRFCPNQKTTCDQLKKKALRCKRRYVMRTTGLVRLDCVRCFRRGKNRRLLSDQFCIARRWFLCISCRRFRAGHKPPTTRTDFDIQRP